MIVRVRVNAGARRETQITISDNKLQISVKEPAADNRANDRVRSMLSVYYRVPVSDIRIISGHHHPSKSFEIIERI